jgi:hypothetical protein
MSTNFIFSLVTVVAAAVLSTAATDRRDFKELAARTAMADEAAKPETKCPLSKEYIDSADLNLVSICLVHGLAAMDAARWYPALAPKVFALYGDDPTFRSVFDRYGHQVIPVVGYFVEEGSTEYQVSQAFHGALQQIRQGQIPTWAGGPSREQMGLMAVYELNERGPEFLAEFEVVDGYAKRKPVESAMLGAKNFFLGGIQKLETVLVRGERSATWTEVGAATLDVAAMAGGVGLLAKEARAADAVASRSTSRVVAVNAYRTLRTVGTIAIGPIGNLALLYVAVTHPALISSAGGWIAEQLGFDPRIGMLIAYLVGFSILVQIFWPSIWCISKITKLVARLRPRSQPAKAAAPF